MEPVEASESGDHLSTYGLPSSSKTPPMSNTIPAAIPNFNFIDPMAMAAVIYDQTGGTSSTASNSSNSSTTSSTNFRCTESLPTPSSVSLAAAYAAASATYPASSSLNGTNKTTHLHSHHHLQNGGNATHHHHNGQHLYSPNNEYVSSSVGTSNGYWPYSSQAYFPSTTRQYMVAQPPSSCPITPTGVSDTSSSSPQQDLSYHTHGSYPHMQKMVGNYPTSYEFYQQHNNKYC